MTTFNKQLTRDELQRMTLADYKTNLRPQLQSGDLLFASGNYMFSQTIQQVTKSLWSHVGLIVCIHDRVLLLESNELMGVRLIPLSRYLHDFSDNKPYDGMVVLARHHDMSEAIARQAICAGMDELTQPYNHAEVAQIVYRVATNQERQHIATPHAYICSELVHYCLEQAELPLVIDKRGFISPQNLWEQPQVEFLGRVL
jgi:hypothetical protein